MSSAPAPALKRGALIVLEGLDRSGKSSQVQLLVKHLQEQGIAAEATRFPDRSTAIGSTINSYLASSNDLDDHAIHLLFSANRWEAARTMEAKLRAGTTLIVDRYAFSGIAFTHAKAHKNPSLTLDWCSSPDVGLLSPDLVLFLNVSPDVAQARGGFGQERYETEEIQKNVRKAFAEVKEKVRTQATQIQWVDLSADGSMDEVRQEILKQALQLVQRDSLPGLRWDLWK